MPDLTDDEQKQILSEVMSDNLKVIIEHLQALAGVPGDIAELKEDVSELKADMKTVKAVLKDMGQHEKSQNLQLDNHETRITSLEAA